MSWRLPAVTFLGCEGLMASTSAFWFLFPFIFGSGNTPKDNASACSFSSLPLFRWGSVCVPGIVSFSASLCQHGSVTCTHSVAAEDGGRGSRAAFPSQKELFHLHISYLPKSCKKNYIMSNSSTECMKQWLSPTPTSSKRRKEKEKELSHSLSFMGTKAEHVCSIWRMQMPPAAFLPLALSKWPFRLNCSSQCSPIKNGQQWGKGYLLIHKR